MDLHTLEQFNTASFRQMLGIHAKQSRFKMGASHFKKNLILQDIDYDQINKFELGKLQLCNKSFQSMLKLYNLNINDVLQIAKLTQIEFIFSIFRELNALT